MIIEDLIIAIANVAFSYAVAVQVIHGFRHRVSAITYQTSSITCLGLWAIAASAYSLGLFLMAATCALAGSFWLCLFIQRCMFGGEQ